MKIHAGIPYPQVAFVLDFSLLVFSYFFVGDL